MQGKKKDWKGNKSNIELQQICTIGQHLVSQQPKWIMYGGKNLENISSK